MRSHWRRDQIQCQIFENIISFKSAQDIFETVFKNILNDGGGSFIF